MQRLEKHQFLRNAVKLRAPLRKSEQLDEEPEFLITNIEQAVRDSPHYYSANKRNNILN